MDPSPEPLNLHAPPAAADTIRIVTLNVHEWLSASFDPEPERIISFISSLQPTVVLLQEVDRAAPREPVDPLTHLATALNMQVDFSPAHSDSVGNAILWKAPLTNVTTKKNNLRVEGTHDRSYILISGSVHGTLLSICCTHLDHLSERKRVRQLEILQKELASIDYILAGDFNSHYAPDYSEEDLDRINNTRRYHWLELVQFDVLQSLTKAGYQVYPREFKPTCPYTTRVDYILFPSTLQQTWQVVKSEITDLVVSDHAAVVMDLKRKSSN